MTDMWNTNPNRPTKEFWVISKAALYEASNHKGPTSGLYWGLWLHSW